MTTRMTWTAIALVMTTGSGIWANLSPAGMAAVERLSPDQIERQIQTLPGWRIESDRLSCTYQFSTFVESVEFVNRLVEPSETLGHHPDLFVSYSRVTVSLTTHDAGGLSQLDFDLAQRITQISAAMPASPSCQL